MREAAAGSSGPRTTAIAAHTLCCTLGDDARQHSCSARPNASRARSRHRSPSWLPPPSSPPPPCCVASARQSRPVAPLAVARSRWAKPRVSIASGSTSPGSQPQPPAVAPAVKPAAWPPAASASASAATARAGRRSIRSALAARTCAKSARRRQSTSPRDGSQPRRVARSRARNLRHLRHLRDLRNLDVPRDQDARR